MISSHLNWEGGWRSQTKLQTDEVVAKVFDVKTEEIGPGEYRFKAEIGKSYSDRCKKDLIYSFGVRIIAVTSRCYVLAPPRDPVRGAFSTAQQYEWITTSSPPH